MNIKKRQPDFVLRILLLSIFIILISENLMAQKKSNPPGDSSKSLVEKVKDYSEKDNFFSKLLKNILVSDDEQQSERTPNDQDKKGIRKLAGKIVRKINIRNLDLFGASVNNPNDTVRNWLQESGNSLHVNTKEWIIKDKLTFSEGKAFRPYDLQESERILRQSKYIYDVRIIPQKIKENVDSVDIMIYVQDIWSINGSASYNPGGKNGSMSFNDINFLGFGNEFKGGLKFDPDRIHGWDWDGSYTFNNIERTFLSANLYYFSERDHEQYGITIGRDFFTPVISWAGGIAQLWQNTRYPTEWGNSLAHVETARYNQQDYWLGYAFDSKPFDPTTVNQNRFNIAARITRTVYSQKPDFDTMNIFQNNILYLGRIGYSYRNYYSDRFIFGLGRTEDVPLINMIELLFGWEKGTNLNRPYYGLKTGYSFYNNQLGYLYGGFQAGGFRDKGGWLDRTSLLEVLYFSKLNAIGTYKWRHYIGSRYSYSYDPLRPQNLLDINNEGGLRGFSDGYLSGNKKLILNYEADVFVPSKLLGFKLAIITFADFGLISSSNTLLTDSKLYQGYGFGFRLKNEHLIFPPIQFMFGYYPNTPEAGGKHFNMFQQSSIYYHFNQFQFSTPSIVSVK